MRRRDFIKGIGGSAVATWPFTADAQRSAMPVIGFIRDGSAQGEARWVGGFHKGLSESGYVEGKNVTVEYHWLEGKYDRLPELLADLVRRQVAVIATLSTLPTQVRSGSSPLQLWPSSLLAQTRSSLVLSTASPSLAGT